MSHYVEAKSVNDTNFINEKYEKCVELMNEAIDEKKIGSVHWSDYRLAYSKGIAHALIVLGFEHEDMSKLCD